MNAVESSNYLIILLSHAEGLHPLITRLEELVPLLQDIERKDIDEMLYMMTVWSELGDLISIQPRKIQISRAYAFSIDEALDSLREQVQNHRTYIEASFQDAISSKIDNLSEECKVLVLMVEEHDFAINLESYCSRMNAAFSLRQQIMMDLPDIRDALNKSERYLWLNRRFSGHLLTFIGSCRIGLTHTLTKNLSNLDTEAKKLDAIIKQSMTQAMRGEESNLSKIVSLENELNALKANLYDTWDNSIVEKDLDIGKDFQHIQDRLEILESAVFKIGHLENLCRLFGRSTGDFDSIIQAFAEARDLHKVLEPYQELLKFTEDIKDHQWDDFIKNQNHYSERLDIFEDIIGRLPKHSKCNIRIWPAFKRFQGALESTKSYVSVLISIARNDLKTRHWIKLRSIIGCEDADPSKGFATAKLWTQELLENRHASAVMI